MVTMSMVQHPLDTLTLWVMVETNQLTTAKQNSTTMKTTEESQHAHRKTTDI